MRNCCSWVSPPLACSFFQSVRTVLHRFVGIWLRFLPYLLSHSTNALCWSVAPSGATTGSTLGVVFGCGLRVAGWMRFNGRLMFTNMRVGAVAAKLRPVKVVIGSDEFKVGGACALACRLFIRIELEWGIEI